MKIRSTARLRIFENRFPVGPLLAAVSTPALGASLFRWINPVWSLFEVFRAPRSSAGPHHNIYRTFDIKRLFLRWLRFSFFFLLLLLVLFPPRAPTQPEHTCTHNKVAYDDTLPLPPPPPCRICDQIQVAVVVSSSTRTHAHT